MNEYFMNFHVFGEIADYLLLKKPQRRLLVDISTNPARHTETGKGQHPSRTTFTILDEELIKSFLANVSIGDLAEATGTFSQSNYVPHKTSYIDTTFVLSGFQKMEKTRYTLNYRGSDIEPASDALLH